MPMTASARRSRACWSSRLNACSRACSHISVYAPICPPTICLRPPRMPRRIFRPQIARMLEQQIERVLARLLAHLGVRADLPTDNLLEAAEDAQADRRRAHDDAAHDALVLGDAVPLDRGVPHHR